METQFLNEHLLPGQIGQFFVVLSFVASLLSFVAYLMASQSKLIVNELSWKKIATVSFYTHIISVFSVFSILFYIIFNHYFEYFYAWSHSSKALPFKYLLSCFWEGQEGSFLLWTIWNCLLSVFILHQKSKWVAPVMTIIAFSQVFLASTLLGIHWGDLKIGTTPFMLLRDQMAGAPIFQQANYLSLIQDGNGLNPLLQNYWMVIHPPILFLGFASTLIPFAYSVAALWKRNYDELIRPLLQWAVFSCMILITGIMMGGAWAYESLNFGGYWAWDPVENASLVPWIVMLAGLHTTMIYKSTGYSLKSTFIFFIFSFILILYSTFLTRTGILGDTSVHAFTGEGSSLFYHLLIYMFLFLGTALFLFFKNYQSIPDSKKEEEALSSREFWMFIGALVMMISVIQITYTTSMPVWNKMFGTKLTVTDPVTHYNKIQIWITLLILLGTSTVYYLKFKQSAMKEVLKKLFLPLILSLLLTGLICYLQDLRSVPIILLMFAAVLSAVANLFYIIQTIKFKVIKWGGTVAHIGFGLMIVGIILSSYNKQVISVNRLGVELNLGKETKEENMKESRENVMLFRDIPISMAGYTVTYKGDTVSGPNHYYKIQYQVRQNDTGRIQEEFILLPNAQINPKMGLVASPDTRHYLTHDVFTYITSTIDKSKITDTTAYDTKTVKTGDTIYFANGFMIFNGFETKTHHKNYLAQAGDVAVSAKLKVYAMNRDTFSAHPTYYIRNQQENKIEDTLQAMNLYVQLAQIIPDENAVKIAFKQPNSMNDYVIMKAILFPYINVLWIGTIIMIIGFGISLYKRITAK